MNLYFNPNNKSFEKDTQGIFYIDKTGLIEKLNAAIDTPKNCIAVSHARRFGKTQAAGMLNAYYNCKSNSEKLFEKYEIAKADSFLKHLNRYNVIHLDMSTFDGNGSENLVDDIKDSIYREMKQEYESLSDLSEGFAKILSEVYELSGKSFVIIIDEYDSVVRNKKNTPEIIHQYFNFLHLIFKSTESRTFLSLGYITGILPIKKVEDESALNNFDEYTMIDSGDLTEYFGFTDDEVRTICERFSLDYESMKQWYDGYLINNTHMYNPNSVYMAVRHKKYDTYWKNTSAFSTINQYINLNFDGLKDAIIAVLSGKNIDLNVFSFTNDLNEIDSKDKALTALVHLGYLAYCEEEKVAFVPNYEVKMAYQAALSSGNWSSVADIISKCDELLKATIAGNQDKVAKLVEAAHEAYTSVIEYNDENSLACVLTMAYFTAPAYYTVVREMPAGVGFADFAFIPRQGYNKPAMIIELKWDTGAESAIKQIKERRYHGLLNNFSNEKILVGISYDKSDKNKKHSCIIEKIGS